MSNPVFTDQHKHTPHIVQQNRNGTQRETSVSRYYEDCHMNLHTSSIKTEILTFPVQDPVHN